MLLVRGIKGVMALIASHLVTPALTCGVEVGSRVDQDRFSVDCECDRKLILVKVAGRLAASVGWMSKGYMALLVSYHGEAEVGVVSQ